MCTHVCCTAKSTACAAAAAFTASGCRRMASVQELQMLYSSKYNLRLRVSVVEPVKLLQGGFSSAMVNVPRE